MLHGPSAEEKCNKRSRTWRQAGRIPPSAWNTMDQNGKERWVGQNIYLPNTEDFDKKIIREAGRKASG
jgi:hypothetical protein